MDWALRACAWHGHETYSPDEAELADRLHVRTAAGQAWRCLRCGNYIPGDPRRTGPADGAPEIPHGKLLRDRIIMRLLAVERLLRALFVFAAAYGLFRFRDNQATARRAFDNELPLLRPIASQIGWNIDDSRVVRLIERAFSLSPTILLWLSLAVAAYGVTQVLEAVGLWLMKRWGEYLAVVATSAFLPIEVYELIERVTVLRVLLILVNLVAVVWLLWSKRLFGIRGGGAAYHAEHSAESILTVERAAIEGETIEQPH